MFFILFVSIVKARESMSSASYYCSSLGPTLAATRRHSPSLAVTRRHSPSLAVTGRRASRPTYLILFNPYFGSNDSPKYKRCAFMLKLLVG
ncbi:unnamed protein product [Danaus chrysippus]|uniref:(African queen) hypothetical protein n=1 Tax=Danaus chrysippus TaxID=151541 RepID=A0A8J2VXW9_9NEOP|nr:unnamed protein product [Danaus chrysippus]